MVDFIYNFIQDMPDNVLKGNIKTFENVIVNIDSKAIENLRTHIQLWKDKLIRRRLDGLYVTNFNGIVKLVDNMGEVK